MLVVPLGYLGTVGTLRQVPPTGQVIFRDLQWQPYYTALRQQQPGLGFEPHRLGGPQVWSFSFGCSFAHDTLISGRHAHDYTTLHYTTLYYVYM